MILAGYGCESDIVKRFFDHLARAGSDFSNGYRPVFGGLPVEAEIMRAMYRAGFEAAPSRIKPDPVAIVQGVLSRRMAEIPLHSLPSPPIRG